MKLITNMISTGKPKSFEEFVKSCTQSQVKTASIKVAEQEEADSSGQLDVEPLHQEGESTTMPKAGPSAKKEAEEVSTEKVAEEKDEADSSGQPEAEGKLTNDPKVPTKEEKGGSTEKKTKVARNRDGTGPEGKGPKTGRGCGPCADEDADEDEEKEETKEAGIKGNCDKCGEPNFLCKCDKGDDDNKDEKEASKKTEFVKVANLDDKNKTFLKEYWRQLFGDAYVDAMIAEK